MHGSEQEAYTMNNILQFVSKSLRFIVHILILGVLTDFLRSMIRNNVRLFPDLVYVVDRVLEHNFFFK